MVKVKINGREYEVKEGITVLDACREAGVYIPTLCYHPRLESIGACRVCVVDIEGARTLQPACTTQVRDGMVINTNNDRVKDAVTTVLSLIRKEHETNCATCHMNGSCELQDLFYRYEIDEVFGPVEDVLDIYDDSSPAVVRDLSKCIECQRCVRACSEWQDMNIYSMVERSYKTYPATPFDLPLYETLCVSCGQCTVACPVGAIYEKQDWKRVLDELEKHEKILVVQTAPATRVAIAEEFGAEPGTISTGKMVAALRKLGFDYVFDTDFSADLTIVEEANEFVHRLKNGGPFPMFTSCCPAWINLAEKEYPQFLKNLSTCKAPQDMMGAVVKTYFAQKLGVKPEDIFHVSIMPCTAKKDDIEREQMLLNGVKTTDVVLTTRELAKLIKLKNIPFFSLEDENYDDPLGESTGAGILFGVTGGVMEAALRTAYEIVTGEELPKLEFNEVRGLEGIREAEIDIAGKKIKVAVAHGLSNVRKLLDKIDSGEAYYDFIEIMACTGGCLGGGGQPRSLDPKVLEKRAEAIYTLDERSVIRKSHENPSIKRLYEVFLEKPNSHIAHELLHTWYKDRSEEFKPKGVLAN